MVVLEIPFGDVTHAVWKDAAQQILIQKPKRDRGKEGWIKGGEFL